MILSRWQIFDILDDLKTQFFCGFFCMFVYHITTMDFLFVKTIGKEIDIQVSMCIAFCWEVTCIVVN